MASFQTHLSVAATGSIAATALCVQAGMASQTEALILLSLGTLAGILPDVDSDHSVPTRLLFNLFGFATAIALIFTFQGRLSLLYLLAGALFAAAIIRYAGYAVFASVTEHRGLFHSIPAAVLAGLMLFSSGIHLLGWSHDFSWLAALFVSGGYLLHLLLDELYSVNFMGASIKASFGSALTLFSRSSWLSYLLLYAVIAAGITALPLPVGRDYWL